MKTFSASLLVLLFCASVARAATLAGVVTDLDGKPVAGAKVLRLGTFAWVETDMKGQFRLENVPEFDDKKPFVVGAAKDEFWAIAQVVEPTLPLQLRLQAGLEPSVKISKQLIEQWPESEDRPGWLQVWPEQIAPYDADFALQLAFAESNPAMRMAQIRVVIETVCEATPEKAMGWAPEKLALLNDNAQARFSAGAAVARVALSSNRSWAQQWFDETLVAARDNFAEENRTSLATMRALTLASFAARLGLENANQLLEIGLQLLSRRPKDERNELYIIFGREMGFGGAALLEKYLTDASPLQRAQILGTAIPALAPHDFPGARRV